MWEMRVHFASVSAVVSKKQISKRVMGMAIMLYVLGLNYDAVEIVLTSLGIGIGLPF
jgi:hypothetical protein